jgi:hypothetical protein
MTKDEAAVVREYQELALEFFDELPDSEFHPRADEMEELR